MQTICVKAAVTPHRNKLCVPKNDPEQEEYYCARSGVDQNLSIREAVVVPRNAASRNNCPWAANRFMKGDILQTKNICVAQPYM